MSSMDFAKFWASQPRFDPFTPAGTPAPINWCTESKPLADWCMRLLAAIGDDPTPAKVAYAKVKLVDNYCRAHAKTSADHRAETNLDNHPCLHQVLLTAWDELENVELRRAVPELYPPASAPTVPIEAAVPRDEANAYAEDVTGIVIGEDDEP